MHSDTVYIPSLTLEFIREKYTLDQLVRKVEESSDKGCFAQRLIPIPDAGVDEVGCVGLGCDDCIFSEVKGTRWSVRLNRPKFEVWEQEETGGD